MLQVQAGVGLADDVDGAPALAHNGHLRRIIIMAIIIRIIIIIIITATIITIII